MFQVVWSSVVHVFWCYSAFVVYISPILSLSCFVSPRVSITTGTVSVAFIPHILSLISIWRSLYFDSSWDGHIKKQAGFILFVLDYNVWSVGLYLTICLSKSILASPTRVWYCFCYCLCLYSSLCRFRRRYRGTQRRFILKYVKNAVEAT